MSNAPAAPAREAVGFVFPSELGWFALEMVGDAVRRASFGYASWREAIVYLNIDPSGDEPRGKTARLIKRLQAYATGKRDDFLDVELAEPRSTPFAQAVIEQCRRIAPGQVLSYGDLAQAAGSAGAARAVGSVMSSNRIAIIVPCHRVVASGGKLGGYSMADGVAVKSRLLALENAGKPGRKRS
ncbi:MAG: methylated-DNA--[protein]-cysteine S-methyltransferase [Planctomycetes bacterium]|nr:methylated-DNA--[protein]-cysteine S-methyltransferase [Planctomycetota bacterium]